MATMLREMHAASKYHGRVGIAEKAMEAMLASLVAQQGQRGPQGSYCAIAELNGRVTGFMVGMLDRVYHIGDKLTANDVYLWVRPRESPIHTMYLIRGYLAWARAIRQVAEIKLSWTDTLPGAERLGRLYRKVGAVKAGEIYEIRVDAGGNQ